MEMVRKPKRGSRVEVPEWWMEQLRGLTARMTQADLAMRLTVALGRDSAIDSSAVSLFFTGNVRTDRMVDGFCKIFPGLLSPFYTARSHAEALAMTQVAAEHGPRPLDPADAPDATPGPFSVARFRRRSPT